MTAMLNGKPHIVPAGSFVFIPRGMKHEHRNDGDTPMIFLTINVPVRDGVAPPIPDNGPAESEASSDQP